MYVCAVVVGGVIGRREVGGRGGEGWEGGKPEGGDTGRALAEEQSRGLLPNHSE